MSKELEALDNLYQGYTDRYYKQFTNSQEEIEKDYNKVKQALTPPEEVSKALSKRLENQLEKANKEISVLCLQNAILKSTLDEIREVVEYLMIFDDSLCNHKIYNILGIDKGSD